MKIAVLVDGAFFLHRARQFWGDQDPQAMARKLRKYCWPHAEEAAYDSKKSVQTCLYRIFYYDCPPADIESVNPISKRHFKTLDSPQALWRLAFLEELKKFRKLALRLGVIDDRNPSWTLSSKKLKQLLDGKIDVGDISEDDVILDFRQKGVDMRIGIDIVSLSLKGQVQRIVLIAADSDFVPAAKMARREGLDFVLDPMWVSIKGNLYEHIDGLKSQVANPKQASKLGQIIRYSCNDQAY